MLLTRVFKVRIELYTIATGIKFYIKYVCMYVHMFVCMYVHAYVHKCMYVCMYSTAHFKLDNTRVQQLHGSTHFQKCPQNFPRAHDRPMTYYHWKLHACMHETFILLACVASTSRMHARDVHFVGVCSLNCTRARTRRSFCWHV